MYTNYPKGSEWRKWDLHIHTPYSISQEYTNTPQSWEKFISALENLPSEVKVIGITDYYFIDGFKKVMEEKEKGRIQNIEKIFPILEFRIDTFGSGNENKLQKVNLHILFDLDEDKLEKEIEKVQKEFIDQINISALDKHKTKKLSKENFILIAGKLESGFESLVPSTKQVFEIINSATWKDRTFLFLGYKEWSNLEKNQQLRPLKEDLYSCVGAFFGNNYSNHTANQKWLNDFGDKRLLHSLDIHDFRSLDTFEIDDNGVKIPSKQYECNTWIKSDPTFEGLKQIMYEPEMRVSIQVTHPDEKTGYQVIDRIEIDSENMSNKRIDFNPNLNSIIGGRSTGKSIFLRAIAKKLKCVQQVSLFDNDYDVFIQSISNKIKVIWRDNVESDNREIEYFQQGYMYEIARNGDKLSEIVRNILSQRGKQRLLDEYYKQDADNSRLISSLISDYYKIKNDIIEKKLRVKDKGDVAGIESEIAMLQSKMNSLTNTEISQEEKDLYERIKQEIAHLTNEATRTNSEIGIITSLKSLPWLKDGIAYELAALTDKNRIVIEVAFNEVKTAAIKSWNEKLTQIIQQIETEKSDKDFILSDRLNNGTYIKVAEEFSKNVQLKDLETKIKIQRNILFELNASIAEILKLEEQAIQLNETIKGKQKLFFENITALVKQIPLSKDGLKIEGIPVFDEEQYKSLLTSAINQQSSENQRLANYGYQNHENFEKHIFDLYSRTLNNSILLKSAYTNQNLATSLMSKNFYKINYDIQYEGDDFKKMSDGKKAFVVLKLLLDFSEKNCPILIDQPEDDLDNRAIYNDLVKYLKKKKQVRQIIVATHNPNIVVGADSELIICANQHGEKNANRDGRKFQYVGGSLEHTLEKNRGKKEILESQGIREHVCEILEGGDVAFKLRERKYAIKGS